jgi:hypothetical protein
VKPTGDDEQPASTKASVTTDRRVAMRRMKA